MGNMKMSYFEDEDILHQCISDEEEAGSVDIAPNVTAELNAEGDLIGIEILGASTFIRDSIMETAQARVLHQGKHDIWPSTSWVIHNA